MGAHANCVALRIQSHTLKVRPRRHTMFGPRPDSAMHVEANPVDAAPRSVPTAPFAKRARRCLSPQRCTACSLTFDLSSALAWLSRCSGWRAWVW
jgi:hypothetical protein